MINKTLMLEEYNLVFIDEFTINNRHSKLKSWTDRGKHGLINISNEIFSKSFAIAFSKDRFYALQDTLGAFDSAAFIEFIKKVKAAYDKEKPKLEKKLVLIIGNAPIHVSRLVKEFCESDHIFVVTICPYSPSLNPCEKVIAAIKEKAKIIEAEGRILGLRSIEKCVKEIISSSLFGYCKASFMETYQKMMHLTSNSKVHSA